MNTEYMWIAVIGAAVAGGIIGFFSGHKMGYKECKEQLDRAHEQNQILANEVSAMVDKNHQLVEQMEKQLDDSIERNMDEVRKSIDVRPGAPVRNFRLGNTWDDFKNLARKYHDDDLDAHIVERESPPEDSPNRLPFEITTDDFNIEYDEVYTLTYYKEDHVLADEHNDKVRTPTDLVGEVLWRKLPNDPRDLVYVRNDDIECVYEVMIDHKGSFRRDVLGLDDEDDLERQRG